MMPGTHLPGLALALAIGLLLGVDRGWQMRGEADGGRVAGIRTFALLGLLGGLAGLLVNGAAWPLAVGLVVGGIGALLLGYAGAMRRDNNVSATSTLAGILTVALGAMATTGNMAIAAVGAGATMILLVLRVPLHQAIRAVSDSDIKALLRLVLVVFIILPLLPDRPMGPLAALNPFRLWTVVVVTGSISFFGYILVRWLGPTRGGLVTAAVGSLVSSTAVTVDAARRLRAGADGPSVQATVAIASAVMFVRSLVLVSIVAPVAFAPFAALVVPGLLVSIAGSAILLYAGRAKPDPVPTGGLKPPGLGLAFMFALTVALLSIASLWAQRQWGGDSGAIIIALGGFADIDAAIAAVGALPAGTLGVDVAALALAAPSLFNTLFKLGLFVVIAGPRRSIPGGIALAAVSLGLLVPILASVT
jgi:uncharacterized membrane protein (DUF4010 family)